MREQEFEEMYADMNTGEEGDEEEDYNNEDEYEVKYDPRDDLWIHFIKFHWLIKSLARLIDLDPLWTLFVSTEKSNISIESHF